MNRLMTANEVACYIGMNVQTIYRKARANELPCYKMGRIVRFKQDEIDAFMKGGRNAKKS